jgi:hypothetical protein
MEQTKIACGVWKLAEHGVSEYVRQYGRKPVALILHPVHIREFYREAGNGPTILDGVSVLTSFRFDMPILVDESGNSYEL